MLYLLDGHSLTFKAYYAIRGLTAPDGSPVGAVYGFFRMLLRLIEDQKATSLAVVFDTGGPTFREELYSQYKANREAPPPDFSDQMVWICRLIDALGIARYELSGFEADDLIATMSDEAAHLGQRVTIISADKDLFQLVGPQVEMLRSTNSGFVRFDADAVQEKLGVRPDQVPDWLAIVGDSSDNIPGVPTIGAKGAVKYLREFGSLENLIASSSGMKNVRQRESLEANVDQARLSLKLATVRRDVPLKWSPEDCRVPEDLFNDEVVGILRQLGFESILREKGIEAAAPDSTQADAEKETVDYRRVTSADELQAWVIAAGAAPWLALDTETTGINSLRDELVGISLSCKAGEGIYIPVGHNPAIETSPQLPLDQVRGILGPIFFPPKGQAAPRLTAHNAKFDWEILDCAGFEMASPDFDSMIASFVLDPARRSGHGLKALASELCGVAMRPIKEIIGSGSNALTCAEVASEDLYEYACRDADVTLRLTELFAGELKKEPRLEALFNDIEIPLTPVLCDMERGGIAVDREQLRRLSDLMSREIHRLGRDITELAGHDFNLDSPKQLSVVLFDELGLPPGKKTKTGFSTNESVLESLASQHPIAEKILDYRSHTKLRSTYAEALPKQINPATGRIHTSFNQTIAQTGRLSSTSPNLQNIPVRSELGREIRRAFIPDAPDHVFVAADYSQIELRVLAHFSADPRLVEAYAVGTDIHSMTAASVFGVEPDEVTAEMRAKAKMVNFGIIYGISAHGLAARLKIGRGEAAAIIDAYFKSYPGVRAWIDDLLDAARRDEFVETLMGRRRRLPDINARNGQLRAAAERVAVNTPIQGTSADMIKIAMIRIASGLAEAAPGARMALQIHDELMFSVPEVEAEACSEFVINTMRDALALDVPIVVDVKTGRNWADCK